MGTQQLVRDRLRERLRDERETRGWSMAIVAEKIARGIPGFYQSTVAKIEAGDRAVQAHELIAYADLFGVTVDALLGRGANTSDVLWATSRLSSNAQRMAGEVDALRARISGDMQQLLGYADREQKRELVKSLIILADRARALLNQARDALGELAAEFPLPGMNLDRAESKPGP